MSEQEKILKPSIEKSLVTEPGRVELPNSPEKVVEAENIINAEKPGEAIVTPVASAPNMSVPPEVERQAEIERILEDDLANVYFNLPDDRKEKFRLQGEATAKEINTLLSAAKIKVQKIIKLIKNWLLIIPGVNRFFLEQEAKLKADEIIKLKDKF